LSRIDLDEGQQLHISTADLKDAFYHFQLPEELRCYFGMRPIFCEQPSCSQSQSIPRSKLYPRLKVLPMGWNHALFWCQAIHQHVVQQAGATIDTCLEDKAIAPASSMFHIEYVDNFIVLGTSKAQVDEVAAAGVKALRDKGLVVHEEESSHGKIKVLGWEFEDTKLRPLSHRVWRVKLAMERLLEVGRVSGRQLEKVVGHASFICLGRREGLSVFGETYTFIHRHYWSPHRIWSSVRRELQIFCGILPLLWRDLSSPWCAEVTATDASTWGLGATTAVFPQHEVKDLGSFSERWRFEHESYRKPRASTMGAAVCGEGEESEVFNWAATNEHNPSNLEPISFFAKKSIDKKFRNLTLDTVLKPWKVVGRYKWKRQEPMPVLEGRAALYAVKHALRDVNHFHKRHLLLSDSISAVCALDRGRGKSFRLRRVTQQVAALSLCSGCSFHYRWLPSEWNPSDAPSRGSRFPVPLSVLAAHGHPPVDPPAEPTKEEVKTTAGKGNTETKREKQSSDLDWTIRQTAKNRSQKTAVERGGLADSSVSGGCVPEEVPGQLEPSEGHYRFEGPEKHEGECAGPSIVPDAEHHVQRWRRSQSCPVHVSSQFVFQSPPEVLEADGVAFDQADTSGLEEAGPSKGSIAVAVGGRVRPSRVIFPGGTERDRADDAALFLSVPPSWRGDSATRAGLGPTGAWIGRRGSRMDCNSSSARRAHTLEDSRVRRDCELRQTLDEVHCGGHLPAPEFVRPRQGREDLQLQCSADEKVHGEGFQQTGVGKFGKCTSIPASSRWGKSGLPAQDALPDRDPEERKVEVCCIGPKVRKRRKTQPTSAKPGAQSLDEAAVRYQKNRKNGPWPALKPGRSLTEKVFLEIFSGSGRLSKKVAQITGWTVLLWDICLGADYDLLNPANRQKLKDWIRGGKVIAFHLGTPCESFSRARDVPPGPPPLRSDDRPLGLDNLKPHDSIKVLTGNVFMRFSAALLHLAWELHIPATLENPDRSRLWLCPPIRSLLRRSMVNRFVTHYCSWGMPYKKATGFLAIHLDLSRISAVMCFGSKRGICRFSDKRHIQLFGQNQQGQWLTKLAQPYPWKLCVALAKCFHDFEVQTIAHNFSKHL
jgi:hypothetical protein